MLEPDFEKVYSHEEISQLFGIPSPGVPSGGTITEVTKNEPRISKEREGDDDPVSVVVRVRPLLPKEISDGAEFLPGLAERSSGDVGKENKKKIPSEVALKREGQQQIGGFHAVFGPEATNETVFSRSFAHTIDTCLRGGISSLFCYGYTGAGKTHSVLGYRDEPGLFYLAARKLLEGLQHSEIAPREATEGENEQQQPFLVATVCEIYGDDAYDLLGTTKLKCELRVDKAGQLQVVSPGEVKELSDIFPHLDMRHEIDGWNDVTGANHYENKDNDDWISHKLKQPHATLVTRTQGLRRQKVFTPDDLDAMTRSSVALRTVGTSTENNQSSRSHAVLQAEVVTQEVLDARDALEDAMAVIPALQNAMDNICMWYYELFDFRTMKLKSFQDVNEWKRRKSLVDARKSPIQKALDEARAKIERLQNELEIATKSAHAAVGGTLVLVDLAGADRDNRDIGSGATQQERKESADINKSLLALKECLRAVAGVTDARPPFRDSKLTRLLQDALMPEAATTKRNNSESKSTMLVNVAPSSHIEKMTINTLRYGQIFAAAAVKGNKGVTASNNRSSSLVAGGNKSSSKPWNQKSRMATDLMKQIRAIYETHCPDKSKEDVDKILSKFVGREKELLQKARAKYCNSQRSI